jgi:hypothetical protein
VLSLSLSCSSELFLALSCHFAWLCRFSCLLLAFAVFLLLDDLRGRSRRPCAEDRGWSHGSGTRWPGG